jgi:hypothetical protein
MPRLLCQGSANSNTDSSAATGELLGLILCMAKCSPCRGDDAPACDGQSQKCMTVGVLNACISRMLPAGRACATSVITTN